MRVKISADSTCDLSTELIEKNDITIVPLYITKGEESLKDGLEITAEDIFAHVDAGNDLCKTSAVNVQDYIDLFTAQRKAYDAVVHFTISSDMSACYTNACIAAGEFDNVYVVDSRNLSTGIGLLILYAANLAAGGEYSGKEIYDMVCAKIGKVETSFVIDDLTYLKMGGRCSSLAALGANILHLKPCIEVTDGKMDVCKKYRGTFQNVLLQYVKERLTGRDDIDGESIFITYPPRTSEEYAQAVEDEIKAMGIFKRIYRTHAGCTISSHCGPHCLGILFMRK